LQSREEIDFGITYHGSGFKPYCPAPVRSYHSFSSELYCGSDLKQELKNYLYTYVTIYAFDPKTKESCHINIPYEADPNYPRCKHEYGVKVTEKDGRFVCDFYHQHYTCPQLS